MYIMLDSMYAYVTMSISTGLYPNWIYGPQINYNYNYFGAKITITTNITIDFACHVYLGYQVTNAPMATLLPCFPTLLTLTVSYGC
jgi:hypothetical protein